MLHNLPMEGLHLPSARNAAIYLVKNVTFIPICLVCVLRLIRWV
ncbi:hypothetical protein [Paenibacillus cisolokensis]|nr:hypothetical protein [Paenibacillus cisolokensis]